MAYVKVPAVKVIDWVQEICSSAVWQATSAWTCTDPRRYSPFQAFRLSYDVGRMYFGQIARFVLTSLFIMFGSLALWNEVVESAPGAIIALVGNAFLGTTLAASSMLFYTDRFRVIRMMRKRAPVQSPSS